MTDSSIAFPRKRKSDAEIDASRDLLATVNGLTVTNTVAKKSKIVEGVNVLASDDLSKLDCKDSNSSQVLNFSQLPQMEASLISITTIIGLLFLMPKNQMLERLKNFQGMGLMMRMIDLKMKIQRIVSMESRSANLLSRKMVRRKQSS